MLSSHVRPSHSCSRDPADDRRYGIGADVLEGGQGLFYGTQAVAGAMNVVTKSSTDASNGTAQMAFDTNEGRHVKAFARSAAGAIERGRRRADWQPRTTSASSTSRAARLRREPAGQDRTGRQWARVLTGYDFQNCSGRDDVLLIEPNTEG